MSIETRADAEKAISKIPGSKTIVVHAELYQRLVIGKAALMMVWADPDKRPEGASSNATFADVIVETFNRADHFAQLMARIITSHPEFKPWIEEAAKEDPELYKLVESMLSVLGKRKSR